MNNRTVEELQNIMYFTLSGDYAEIFKNKSFAPIAGMILNLHPCVRTKPGGILLLGIIPPGVKTDARHRLVYKAILDTLKAEGAFSGFPIMDAYLQKKRTCAMQLAWVLEDLKGLPIPLSCKTTCSKVGADPWCDMEGYKINGTRGATIYYCAITMLPIRDPLRKLFKKEFAQKKQIQALADVEGPPNERTAEECIASGTRCAGKHKDTEPYFDVSIFWEVLKFNVYRKSIYDMAHGLGNNLGDLFRLVFNYGNNEFTNVKKAFEKDEMKRFEDYAARDTMPWQCPSARKKELSDLLTSGHLRVPIGWPSVLDLTSKAPCKIAEKLMLGGEYGKWILGLCQLEAEHFVSGCMGVKLFLKYV
jgi:hypothetical protein